MMHGQAHWGGESPFKIVFEPFERVTPPEPKEAVGFFTDSSICIGCKACEVACKQWNQLPADGQTFLATSYDNTHSLSATTWRHVQFIEQADERGKLRWLFNSDVCKHCADAPCENACPTGAIVRTEFDTVYVQQDICNGCGYCVVACPFGVIDVEHGESAQAVGPASAAATIAGTAHKCTLCYDRLKDGYEPACAKVCPTDSIQFGNLEELRARARQRVEELRARGQTQAQLYGESQAQELGGLHAFFLLMDEPEYYNLPRQPRSPKRAMARAYVTGLAAAFALTGAIALALWSD
jgi:formate dehydrogenase iron-sulfur subunit